MFRERIQPGAFSEALKTSDVRALLNHNPNYVLGRNKNSTLKLWEDDTGLAVDINPPGTQWANDVLVSIDRGDINQMSFGFIVGEDKWTEEEGAAIRTIVRVDRLFDVSPVTFPAYPETDTSLRAMFAEKVKALSAINENPAAQAGAGSITRGTQARDLEYYRRRLRLIELSA
jgi:HK97 family phage prohead protease